MRASPARGHAALLVLLVPAAEPAGPWPGDTPRSVRDRNAQPPVEPAGLRLDPGVVARPVRVARLERAAPRDDAGAEARAAYATVAGELQQAAERGRCVDAAACLQHLPQNPRTRIEARLVRALAGRAPAAAEAGS